MSDTFRPLYLAVNNGETLAPPKSSTPKHILQIGETRIDLTHLSPDVVYRLQQIARVHGAITEKAEEAAESFQQAARLRREAQTFKRQAKQICLTSIVISALTVVTAIRFLK